MGEQPVPVEDEVERALASMRAGFLSGSEQIAAGVASLEEHLADASFEERESVGAAVAQIVKTQARLIAQLDRSPASSWDRFKAMVSVVKAQQSILDQLGALVKEHVLPRQLQDLSATPFPAALAAAREPAPRRAASRSAGDEPRGPLSRTRERSGTAFSGLVVMVVAGLVLSFVPRDIKLQDVAARFVQMIGAGGGTASPEVPDAKAPTPPPAPATRAERVPPLPDAATATDRPGPAARVPADEEQAAALPDVAAIADRTGATAPVQPDQKRVPEPAVDNEPAMRPANLPSEKFVPVVFTHRDQATAMRALTDLKQQYPNLLIGRKGEVQPIDLGKKGVWHRLVLLPAGPRPEATKLCDQLMAKGYDRCWVKAY